MEEIKIIERSDGFQYLILNDVQVVDIFSNGLFELYRLYNDDSESLIKTVEDIKETQQKGLLIGIPIGFKYPKIKISDIVLGDLIKELCDNGGLYQCIKRIDRTVIVCSHIDGDTFDYTADFDGNFEFSEGVVFGLVYRCSSSKQIVNVDTIGNSDLYQISSHVIEWINKNLNPNATVIIDNTSATVYEACSHININTQKDAHTDNE